MFCPTTIHKNPNEKQTEHISDNNFDWDTIYNQDGYLQTMIDKPTWAKSIDVSLQDTMTKILNKFTMLPAIQDFFDQLLEVVCILPTPSMPSQNVFSAKIKDSRIQTTRPNSQISNNTCVTKASMTQAIKLESKDTHMEAYTVQKLIELVGEKKNKGSVTNKSKISNKLPTVITQ